MQEYFARAETQLTHEMLSLELNDHTGRMNLAAAINATRGAQRYLIALAQDATSATRELERIRSGASRKEFF